MDERLQRKHTGLWFGDDVDILFDDWPAGHSKFYFCFAIFLVFCLSMLAHICTAFPLTMPEMTARSLLRHASLQALRTFIIYLVPLCVITFNLGVIITLLFGQLIGFLAVTLYIQYHNVDPSPDPPPAAPAKALSLVR